MFIINDTWCNTIHCAYLPWNYQNQLLQTAKEAIFHHNIILSRAYPSFPSSLRPFVNTSSSFCSFPIQAMIHKISTTGNVSPVDLYINCDSFIMFLRIMKDLELLKHIQTLSIDEKGFPLVVRQFSNLQCTGLVGIRRGMSASNIAHIYKTCMLTGFFFALMLKTWRLLIEIAGLRQLPTAFTPYLW